MLGSMQHPRRVLLLTNTLFLLVEYCRLVGGLFKYVALFISSMSSQYAVSNWSMRSASSMDHYIIGNHIKSSVCIHVTHI